MVPVKSDYILKTILKEKYPIASWGHRKKSIFKVDSEEFLKFAKSDLKEGKRKSWVNALSNVKRAIDCRIDSILWVLGLYKKSKKEKWRFPYKVDFVKSLGIVSPNILKKVNKIRNRLEHEYEYPTKKEVEDAIDIAELFLASTEKYLREFYSFTVDVSTNKKFAKYTNGVLTDWELGFEYFPEQRIFRISLSGKELFEISESHPKFKELFKRYIESIKNS